MNNNQTNAGYRGYMVGALMCLFATLSWGSMFPVMTTVLQHINAFAFTLIRYSAAAAVFALFLYMKEGPAAFSTGKRPFLVWALGSLGFAGFGFFVFFGQSLAGSSGALSASVMMALMPMLSVLINWGFRGLKVRLPTLVFVAMSFSGVLTVVTKGNYALLLNLKGHAAADGLILLGALCWVLYTTGASFFPNWSALRYTTMTTMFGVPTIWAVNLALHVVGMNPIPSAADIANILPHTLYMILVAGFLGVLAWNSGNRIITPLNGVLFMDVVPITTFVISALLGYAFCYAELVGAGITISALFLNNFYQRSALQRVPRAVTSS